MGWIPRIAPSLDWQRLTLSAEDGFVLSRIDGHTPVEQLVHLTGLPAAVLEQTLQHLLSQGALERPSEPAVVPVAVAMAPQPPAPEPLVSEDVVLPIVDDSPLDDDVDAPPDDTAPLPEAATEPPVEESPAASDDEPRSMEYRKIFETELHPLERDVRIAMVQKAEGATLMAFCYDPDPGVIKALVENALTGFDHARLIAANHHHPMGLEALAQRAELLRDAAVQRMLLRNVQLSDGLFRKLMGTRPMRDIHRATYDRDVSERSRQRARVLLRTRFSTAQPEERVEAILSSEGRVLPLLSGLPLDAKTTSLLCGRTYNSLVLIQNLVRFPGVLPPLLMHLLKQPLVKRQPQLRNMILQHPNAPSDLKRRAM